MSALLVCEQSDHRVVKLVMTDKLGGECPLCGAEVGSDLAGHPEAAQLAFVLEGEVLTGTLEDYAHAWQAAHYSGLSMGSTYRLTPEEKLVETAVRAIHHGTDAALWMHVGLYLFDSEGQTLEMTEITLDGRA